MELDGAGLFYIFYMELDGAGLFYIFCMELEDRLAVVWAFSVYMSAQPDRDA